MIAALSAAPPGSQETRRDSVSDHTRSLRPISGVPAPADPPASPGWPGADPTILLPYNPSSVAGARKALAADLRARGIGEEVISDAILVLSEMLSNALKHASPLPDSGRVRLGWTVERAEHSCGQPTSEAQVATVYLMVNDGGGTTRPRVLTVPQSATGGRGLSIVTSLADEWGVDEGHGGGTTMWVRFYDGLPGSRSERVMRRIHTQAHPQDSH